MSEVKGSEPPARPPAPKLSLSKNRQLSDGSIPVSIHFNTAAEDLWGVELEPMSKRTGKEEANGTDTVFTNDMAIDSKKPATATAKLTEQGWVSAPVSKVSTPASEPAGGSSDYSPLTLSKHQMSPSRQVPQKAQREKTPTKVEKSEEGIRGRFEQKSFISGIRERFQDPFNAIIEKIEESGIKETIDRKLRKTDSFDYQKNNSQSAQQRSQEILATKSISDPNIHDLEQTNPMEDGLGGFRNSSSSKSSPVHSGRASPEKGTYVGDKAALRGSSVSGVEDLYDIPDVDFLDGATGGVDVMQVNGVSVPKSSSYDSLSGRQAETSLGGSQKLSIQSVKRLINKTIPKSSSGGSYDSNQNKKTGKEKESQAMSLSGLLSSESLALEHVEGGDLKSKPDTLQFYDTKDEPGISPSSSTHRLSHQQHKRSSSLPQTPVVPEAETVKEAQTDLVQQREQQQQQQEELPNSRKIPLPTRYTYLSILVGFVAYIVVPLPPHLSGFVVGAAVASLLCYLYLLYSASPQQPRPFFLPDLQAQPALQVPEMKESHVEGQKFKVHH